MSKAKAARLLGDLFAIPLCAGQVCAIESEVGRQLKPIVDDLLKFGRRNAPPRPWLGLYATEVEDRLVIVGLAERGPAKQAELHVGDIVLSVAGKDVRDLASFFRRIWALGQAGVEVPMAVYRDGETLQMRIKSSERSRFLKGPSLH